MLTVKDKREYSASLGKLVVPKIEVSEASQTNRFALHSVEAYTAAAMDERDLYTEKQETKRASYSCPK